MIQNKYSRIYNCLITNAQSMNRKRSEGYFEKHHIIPVSIDSTLKFEPSNLVLLTAKEHFIAHLLLTKCYHGLQQQKMLHAFKMFRSGKRNNHLPLTAGRYQLLKLAASRASKGRKRSEKQVASMLAGKRAKGAWNKGLKMSQSFKDNLKGRKISEITKIKISESKKGQIPHNKGVCHSDATKKKIAQANSKIKWRIFPHYGDSFIITNLNAFCKENGLTQSSLYNTSRYPDRRHGGYRAERVS